MDYLIELAGAEAAREAEDTLGVAGVPLDCTVDWMNRVNWYKDPDRGIKIIVLTSSREPCCATGTRTG